MPLGGLPPLATLLHCDEVHQLSKNTESAVRFVTGKWSEVPNVGSIPKANSPILCKGSVEHTSQSEIKLLHFVNSGFVHACVWRVFFFGISPIFSMAVYCQGGVGQPLSTTALH